MVVLNLPCTPEPAERRALLDKIYLLNPGGALVLRRKNLA